MWYETTVPPRGLWCAARECPAAPFWFWWLVGAEACLGISTVVRSSVGGNFARDPVGFIHGQACLIVLGSPRGWNGGQVIDP